jgi:protein-disulfide isomerase-like protein with CxxC motif
MSEDVTFWFDPVCPFTWRASRWLVAVTGARGHTVDWRLLSLAMLNAGKEIPAEYRDEVARSIGAVRLLHAAGETHGQAARAALYTEVGTRIHDAGRPFDAELAAEALAAADLPADLVKVIDDATLDPGIRASHDAAQARVGTETGSPVTAIGDGPGFFGPVVVPVPGGESAEKLYDALRLLSAVPEFAELKRARAPIG